MRWSQRSTGRGWLSPRALSTGVILATVLGLTGAAPVGAISRLTPVLEDDTYSFQENTTLKLPAPGVLANDFPDSGVTVYVPLVIFIPPLGPACNNDQGFPFNSDGSLTCVAPPNFLGTFSASYTASNSNGSGGPADVQFTVVAPPVASDVNFQVPENGKLVTPAPGFLGGALPRGELHSISLASLGPGCKEGVAAFHSDGVISCTLPKGFAGTITYKFTTAYPGVYNSKSNVATINLVVAPTAVAPGASAAPAPANPGPTAAAPTTPKGSSAPQPSKGPGSPGTGPAGNPNAGASPTAGDLGLADGAGNGTSAVPAAGAPAPGSVDSGLSTPLVIVLVLMALLIGGLSAGLVFALRRKTDSS